MKASIDGLSTVLDAESEHHALVMFLRRGVANARGEDPARGARALSRVPLRHLWEASDVSAHDLADEVATRYRLPRLGLSDLMETRALCARFSPRFLRDAALFPFEAGDGVLRLAMADPGDSAVLRAAEIELGAPLEIAVASFDDIATALAQRIGETSAVDSEVATASSAAAEESVENLRDLASGAPVVRAFDEILEKAIDLRASDVHIEPTRDGLTVRFRVDGLLRLVAAPHDVMPHALISRIKIVSGLNIAERRLPQDGAARLKVARVEVDIRVATMPTQHGEAAVLRLLPRDRGLIDVGKLGFSSDDERKVRRAIEFPHGMIVITGPTGSGKTTTLATMLSMLNTPTRKILTIEDPIEYEIPGVNQSQVKPSIGLTFAAAMRAFVRQDPDVIMVGEIRDHETAGIAIHAALTGHLVLTTLHTETAAAAAPRLIDLGVESFLLKSTLRMVLAQRLVRQLCERCKTRRTLGASDVAADPRYQICGFSAGDVVHEPAGCERCGGSGYRGRIGVFEAMEVAGETRDLIGPKIDAHTLDEAAIRNGMTTMMQDAVGKCRAGLTSVAEVLRVTMAR